MDMSKYRGMFLSETKEHLKSMGRQIVTLEKDPSDREGIDALFRNAHSIKGMAASMGYDNTAHLAHFLEDLMDGFRQTGTVSSSAVDRILEGIDLFEGLLEDIEQESPEREVEPFIQEARACCEAEQGASVADEGQASLPAEQPPLPEEALQVRIELAPDAAAPAARAILIFRELAQMGNLSYRSPTQEELISGARIHTLSAHLKSALVPEQVKSALAAMADVATVSVQCGRKPEPAEAASERAAEPARRKDEGGRTVRVRTELLDRFINITGELITNRYMLQSSVEQGRLPAVKEGLGQLTRLLTDLHDHVLQVRMLPLESITDRLPRLVRDLARKTGKQVSLQLEGEGIELDRSILEELADPLVHMIRNAVDHGIDQQGTVSVSASREKDLVLIEVADDGRGMDPEKIRNKALEKGLITLQQSQSLRDQDALQLVCVPGFSTAGQITETSGRGVGMDVVKNSVEALGGMLQISSEQGRGTKIQLKLPLSVAIIKILLVECQDNLVGIPITRVYRTLDIPSQEVRSSGKQLVIRFEDEVIPLLSLRRVLEMPDSEPGGSLAVVITEYRGRKVGLVVDRLAGQREAFVKSLAFPLDRITGINGATFLGDGNIVFIIDPQGLIEGNLFPTRSDAGDEE